MTDEERKRAAEAVLSIPFFTNLINELESAAVNACIFAPINDDETRRNQAAEARAIKRIRSRIESIASGGQISVDRNAPA
jgi:hypothetical protein